MEQPKIFITRIIPDSGLLLVKKYFSPDIWTQNLPPTQDELIKRARGVNGLLCLLTDKVDDTVMDEIGPQLKVISNMAVGVDNIDVSSATERGIPVGNTPGVLTDATADQAFALMLSAARRIVEADRFIKAGKWVTWQPSLLIGADFAGSTLGIVGFGRIGQAVAKRAQGFDMNILYYSPYLNQFVQPDTIVPDPRIPADFNRYAYVRNNPVNHTDPSGHCPGPFDESDQCWQLLIQIENGYSFIDLQTELSKDNYWTYDELLIVQEALDRYDRAARLDLATLYPGDLKIKRERVTIRINDNYIKCGDTPKYFSFLNRPINIYNGFVDQCVIHELAHYLDFHESRLSKAFAKYIGAYNWFGYHTGPESPPVYLGKKST